MEPKVTLATLSREIITEADAYLYLEGLYWGDTPRCAHCASTNVSLMAPRGAAGRLTRSGEPTQRRTWQCKTCRKQFSVLTGTVMHGTRASIRTWVLVMFEMCASKNGVSAREIERKYGLCPRTAWFMAHRLREAMKRDDSAPLLTGTVVSDETWLGGDPKNRHANARVGQPRYPRRVKTPVVTLINRETGEARSEMVHTVSGDTLYMVIKANVNARYTHLQTDSAGAYQRVEWLFAEHTTVDHKAGQYVHTNGASTNLAENYFSQLKRSLDGTHHHVSAEHLPRYLAEFDFRYSTRQVSDAARVRLLAKQMGRRIEYKLAKAPASTLRDRPLGRSLFPEQLAF